jgi:D-glycero-alpha-D-manno-heptose-7-phosphate kinase
MNIYEVNENESIKSALKIIDENNQGLVCISDDYKKIVGVATDGDIRRELLKGATLDEPIKLCANKDFTYARDIDDREALLKLLDNNVKAFPILDKNNYFIDLISKSNLPISKDKINFARSKAPVRISFGGGGSDLTHFFSKSKGAVINATISIYSHAILKKRKDKSIKIKSWDLDEELIAKDTNDLFHKKSKLGLIQSIVKLLNPNFGFDLEIFSDFPSNSGLGGSSAVSAAVLGCFNEFRDDPWDTYELSELAFQAERLYLNIAGGWQDQYACTFGGFNFIEFTKETNIIHPLRIPAKTLLELEENLVLCNTGIAHESGNIHNDQKKNMENESVEKLVIENVKHVYKIKNQLLKGKLADFGSSLDKSWLNKREFSNKISSPLIDKIYDGAKKNGAVGGKLLGAGGGGFFLFYVPPFKRNNLEKYLKSIGLEIFRFNFDNAGLQTWKTREDLT